MAVKVRKIARELSMSPGTVSRALRGGQGQVSAGVVRKVIGHCIENGHMHKDEAKQLLIRFSADVGQKHFFIMSRPEMAVFYGEVTRGISETLQKEGDFPSTAYVNGVGSLDQFPFDKAGVAILLGRISHDVVERLVEKGVAVLLVDNRLDDMQVPAINSCNLESVASSVMMLAKLGHKRIGFICLHQDTPNHIYTFHQRQFGYISGLMRAGLSYDENLLFTTEATDYYSGKIVGDPVRDDIYRLAERVIKIKKPPTAVLCANDTMAYHLRDFLNSKGFRVPEDISIVGYDGQHKFFGAAGVSFSPVSTNVVNWYQMGVRAADVACDLMINPASGPVFMEVPVEYEDNGTVAVPRT